MFMNEWFVQPFNGQAARYRQLIRISEKLNPTVAIETGTYLGISTPILATLVTGRTYTIEYVQEFAEKARSKFELYSPDAPIELIVGDSGTQIHYVLQKLNPSTEVVLAYLDAHWEKNIPLTTELSELISWGDNWIAVIDDFKIPGDASYGFDTYGDKILDKSLIPEATDVLVFVPSRKGESETGARRGTAYVFGPAYKEMDFGQDFPELRPI